MNIVIFGTGCFADLLKYFILQDKSNKILGFTVDACYLSQNQLAGG